MANCNRFRGDRTQRASWALAALVLLLFSSFANFSATVSAQATQVSQPHFFPQGSFFFPSPTHSYPSIPSGIVELAGSIGTKLDSFGKSLESEFSPLVESPSQDPTPNTVVANLSAPLGGISWTTSAAYDSGNKELYIPGGSASGGDAVIAVNTTSQVV